MKRSQSIVGLVLLASIGYTQTAIAQVSTDGTVGTIVSTGSVFNITGGSRPGNGPNLFHSFSQFSLPTGSSAIFQNDPAVQTIFSRVTGGSRSDINGIIQTQGKASLFLMNPNGIVFGPNAKLELGGSFVGTTANSIKFEDGIEFSAANLTTNPLLTVNLPIGLQMGTTPEAITVQGNGHRLSTPNSELNPINRSANTGGLQVQSGRTLALVGGDIALQGGMLIAEGGRVELGSLRSAGTVQLATIPLGFTFDYAGIENLGTIRLAQKSLVDVSGSPSGDLQVQGNQVTLTEGSLLLSQNQGTQAGGIIRVQARESLTASGVIAPQQIRSGIVSGTLGDGTSANIVIRTGKLTIQDGAGIVNRSGGKGNSGFIDIQASESVQVRDFNPANFFSSINVSALPTAEGNAGNVTIVTPQLTVANGAVIGSVTSSRRGSKGGNLMINADRIEVVGNHLPSATALSTASFGSGKAGDVIINTRSLLVRDSAAITSSSLSQGNAGNIQITATDSVEVRGNIPGGITPSQIRSAIIAPSRNAQRFFGIAPTPTGAGGNVKINTPMLTIADQASITVRNQGIGNAGNIYLTANTIRLDNGGANLPNNLGGVTATTNSGTGGEIVIQSDVLFLRRGSVIATDAKNSGAGGNININSPIIVGLENSDIIANAIGGRGGNISIITQDLIGLKFRNTRSPRTDFTNDITASSEFSINGNVSINTIGIDPNSGLISLPVDLTDTSRQIADRCAAAQTGSFVYTGRGGIPKSPIQTRKSDRTWNDLRDTRTDRSATTAVMTPIAQAPIVEASALRTNADGSIDLIAPMPSSIDSGATCALQ